MANIANIKVLWNGIPGMPGYSNFYSDAAATIPKTGLAAFFTAFAAAVPQGLTWTIPSSGDIFDSTTGLLVGTWSQGTDTVVSSTSVGSVWSGGSGCVVNWATAGIAAGRRVRGKTFIVPLNTSNYDNGSLTSSFLTGARAAAAALVTAAGADLRIWHRPLGGSGGAAFSITGSSVPDLAAVLRSRRD